VITGVGVDVVHVFRLERWRRTPGLLERYFHPEELSAALSRGKGANVSLAARFAAKEAFGKALGTGLSGITLKDILVTNQHNGQPEIKVFGSARRMLEKNGASRVFISLTHEQDNAIALVVLEAV
jgi:holo-[acyl-carrier protein] synthase